MLGVQMLDRIETNGTGVVPVEGVVRRVRAGTLYSDPKIQREHYADSIQQFADEWDDNKCEVITLNLRPNGVLSIVEGAKRVSAKKLKFGPEAEILAKIVSLGGVDEAEWQARERELMKAINKSRKHYTKTQEAQQALNFDEEPWHSINKTVRNHGMFIQFVGTQSGGQKDWRGILSIATLRSLYDSELLTPVLQVVSYCWMGKPMSTDPMVLRGVGEFIKLHALTLDEKQQLKMLNRLREIDPLRIASRAKDYQACRRPVERHTEALVSLYNDLLPRGCKKVG